MGVNYIGPVGYLGEGWGVSYIGPVRRIIGRLQLRRRGHQEPFGV